MALQAWGVAQQLVVGQYLVVGEIRGATHRAQWGLAFGRQQSHVDPKVELDRHAPVEFDRHAVVAMLQGPL